jgi:hypothetical protein
MSSIMRWRNGLMACLVIGDAPVLSEVVEPLDLKTGRPVALSSWLRHQPRPPTPLARLGHTSRIKEHLRLTDERASRKWAAIRDIQRAALKP